MPGVYLSYPFCAQKCTYCNFASGVFPRSLEPQYREALQAELRAHPWQWSPETVYLGGGTPSQMDPQALAVLLALVPDRPWSEATLEAAPGTITVEAYTDESVRYKLAAAKLTITARQVNLRPEA